MKTIVNYAQKVKEQHALNKTLAPVETDLTDASRSYAIGEQFINDGDLFKAKTAIAQHDALVLNTNYEAADDITTQIKNKTVTTDPVPTENSTNPVQSNGVFVENQNIYEVMGALGAKNYLQILASGTATTNGVTFVVNDDGTITVSTDVNGATADTNYYLNPASQTWVDPDYPIGNYILSGCPAGGSAGTYRLALSRQGASSVLDTGAGTTFTHASGVKVLALIQIGTGTVLTTPIVFKPMIRLATDTDNTFQPYAKTNQQLTAENEALTNKLNNEIATRAMLSAHNLFGVGNSLDEWFAATNDGKLPTSYLASETITGTVDKDTNSIVITAYNNTGYRWGCKKINLKKNTSYTFSRTSCDGTIQLFGKNNADDRAVVISGLSNGGTVNSGDYDWWYVGFYPTRSGGYFSITDLLVKLETDADTTFQSYAKTNQELTAENQTLTNKLADEVETRAKLGAHNLLPHDAITSASTVQGVTYTPNSSDFSISISGTAAATNGQYISNSKLYAGTYKIRFEATGTLNDNTKLFFMAKLCQADGTSINNDYVSIHPNEEVTVTIEGTNYLTAFRLYTLAGAAFTNSYKIKPLIKLASDPSTAYAPYAMTNRELTEVKTAVSTNGNLSFVKVGRVVLCRLLANNVTLASGDSVGDIPDGFIPLIDGLQMIETVQMKMLTVSANNKNITTNNAYTNSNIRGTVTWLV